MAPICAYLSVVVPLGAEAYVHPAGLSESRKAVAPVLPETRLRGVRVGVCVCVCVCARARAPSVPMCMFACGIGGYCQVCCFHVYLHASQVRKNTLRCVCVKAIHHGMGPVTVRNEIHVITALTAYSYLP